MRCLSVIVCLLLGLIETNCQAEWLDRFTFKPPQVSRDGIVRQDGNLVSSIGLFEYEPTADFRRHGSSGIIAESQPQPVVNTQGVGMLQGFIEESNVNPIEEMSKLIIVHRTFDQIAAAIRDTEGSQEKAIETLGAG